MSKASNQIIYMQRTHTELPPGLNPFNNFNAEFVEDMHNPDRFHISDILTEKLCPN